MIEVEFVIFANIKFQEEKNIWDFNILASSTINICVICLKNALSKMNKKEYYEINKRHESEGILQELIKWKKQ